MKSKALKVRDLMSLMAGMVRKGQLSLDEEVYISSDGEGNSFSKITKDSLVLHAEGLTFYPR